MSKEYTSLGLMSGTSGDGVDASIIATNGDMKYREIENRYFEYTDNIFKKIHFLKDNIYTLKDLIKLDKEINDLEKKITLFHAAVTSEMNKFKTIDLVGFHGQTIYHNPKEKISKQLGDGNLLSQLTKKNVVFNFRNNDIKNGGEGAPLSPIFHQLIATKLKIDLPVCILNIGGIANISIIEEPFGSNNFSSKDIGPGNCLIDSWVRKNSKKKYDNDGILAKTGKMNEIIFEQAQELFSSRFNKKILSFDVNDFDVSFARGLNLEDGAATLTEFTASIISATLSSLDKKISKILICGGGRKNSYLIGLIRNKISKDIIIESIDNYGVNGDFIESQAFAFLATRSILKLPISFPLTTGCKEPITGGEIVEY